MIVSKFEFLKDVNENLYESGVKIEKQINNAPLEVLHEGVNFLEKMVVDVYSRENLEYINSDSFFSKCAKLVEKNIISNSFRSNILRAYIIKNKIHKKTPENTENKEINKKRAVNMYNLILKCGKFYFEYASNKPKIQYSNVSIDNQILSKFDRNDLKNIKVKKCIICGSHVKSSIFCRKCLSKKALLRPLKELISKFGYYQLFSKTSLKFDNYTQKQLDNLFFKLVENNLIFSIYGGYEFHEENVKEFIETVELFDVVAKLAGLYFSDKITLLDIQNYQSNIKTDNVVFENFYNLVYNDALGKFLKELEDGKSIKEVMKRGIFPINDYNQLIREDKYEIINEAVKNEYLSLKRLNRNDNVIAKDLFISKKNIGEILTKINKCIKYSYLSLLKDGKSYEDALRVNNLKQVDIDQFLKEDNEFREKFNEIFSMRKELFLKLLENNGFVDALKESKLTLDQIDKLTKAKRYDSFYQTANNILKRKYLQFRAQGKTHNQALGICQISENTFEKWINNEEFRKQTEVIKLSLLIDSFKSGKSLEYGLKVSNISKKEFNNYIIEGYSKNPKYSNLLEVFRQNFIPVLFEEFFKKFNKNTESESLRLIDLDKAVFDMELKMTPSLLDKYLKIKKEKYVEESLRKSPKKALENSSLTKQEYAKFKGELESEVRNLKMQTVIAELENKSNTVKAARKVRIKVKDIYKWYSEGVKGNKQYVKFSKAFREVFIIPAIDSVKYFEKLYSLGPNKVLDFLKFKGLICQEDITFWKKYKILESIMEFNIRLNGINFK